MKRLILTSEASPTLSDFAEVVVWFTFRFVAGPLPSPDELAAYVAKRSKSHGPGKHWSGFTGRWPQAARRRKNLALAEFCQPYDIVELWFDPDPNSQLQLIWLLDCLSFHPEIAAKLKLRPVDFDLFIPHGMNLHKWESQAPIIDVTASEFETAKMAWQAYRASTPESCVNLLHKDLSALPMLRPALRDLLAELPSRVTGLGATEMRLLELIALGYLATNGLFYLPTLRQTRVFRELEIGSLIEGLAHGPRPAVAGLDDELRTLEKEKYGPRLKAFQRSRLSLTEFGKSIVADKEDFSRHNPIHRWWGGTELTNDRLWRWDPVLIAP